MIQRTQVLIVGGGPAGSATAWHLAQLGVAATIVDRATFPRDKVCAEYLSPECSRIFAAMGALPLLLQRGAAQLAGIMVRAPNGKEIRGRFDAPHGFHPFAPRGLAIRRTILDTILLERARDAGAHVRERMHVTDLVRDIHGRTTGAIVRDEHGMEQTIHASIVVGADGLRSIVGRRLGLTRVRHRPHRIALVAHYINVPDGGELGEMHVESDGYVGIANVGNGLTNVALVIPAEHAAEGDRSTLLDGWLLRHPHLARRFVASERVTAVRATGPFASASTRAWAPGAALVGDAADFFDPFTGEGVYSALRGGELLAPYIADELASGTGTGAGTGTALAEYDRARRRTFAGKWRVEQLIAGTVAVPWLINHAARALTRHPDMADLLIGVTGDFVPAREVLRFGYVTRLLLYGI